MKLTPIPNFAGLGVYVDNVDLQGMTDVELEALKKQLYTQYLLVIFRNTNLTLERYIEVIGRVWGKTSVGPKTFCRKYNLKADELSEIKNPDFVKTKNIDSDDLRRLGTVFSKLPVHVHQGLVALKLVGKTVEGDERFLEGDLGWHCDESMDLTFCDSIALYGNQSMTKSATGFVTTAGWYEKQTEAFRSELNDMIATLEFNKYEFNDQLNEDEEIIVRDSVGYDERMPLVVTTRGGFTGIRCPWDSFAGIEGMPDAEFQKFKERLHKEIMVEENIYDHWYQQDNDMLMFDNSISFHRRLGSTLNRIAYRIPFYYNEPVAERYKQLEFNEQYKKLLPNLIRA